MQKIPLQCSTKSFSPWQILNICFLSLLLAPIISRVSTLPGIKVVLQIDSTVCYTVTIPSKHNFTFCYSTLRFIFKLRISLLLLLSPWCCGSWWLSPRNWNSQGDRGHITLPPKPPCWVHGVYLEWNLGEGENTLSFCFSFVSDGQFSKQHKTSQDVILTKHFVEVRGVELAFSFFFPLTLLSP